MLGTLLFVDNKRWYEQMFIIVNWKCHKPLGLTKIKKEIPYYMMGKN